MDTSSDMSSFEGENDINDGFEEDVLEPYLIQQGYMTRTSRGRVVTEKAWLHFGLDKPKEGS